MVAQNLNRVCETAPVANQPSQIMAHLRIAGLDRVCFGLVPHRQVMGDAIVKFDDVWANRSRKSVTRNGLILFRKQDCSQASVPLGYHIELRIVDYIR